MGMKIYEKLIKPVMLVPASANDYSPKKVPIEPEEKWYPEEDHETLTKKYKHLETTFETLVFEEKYEEVDFAMLKEQETHILTIDHLEDALDTVVWLETPVSENLADGYSLIMAYSHKCGWMLFDSPFGDNPSQDRLEYSEYGKSWRCWNKRPTDEQRQAVKWDDSDN